MKKKNELVEDLEILAAGVLIILFFAALFFACGFAIAFAFELAQRIFG